MAATAFGHQQGQQADTNQGIDFRLGDRRGHDTGDIGSTQLGTGDHTGDQQGIATQQLSPLLATGMPPVTQVLADVMLCYWPLASWQPQLPPGWTLRDQGLTRRLRAPDGALVSEIHYRDIDGVREPVSLQQHVFHYRLQLETLSR